MSHRIMGTKLYLNEKINLIQWQHRHLERMARELSSYQPVILEANPALLARLAWWAQDEGVELGRRDVIVFTYEFASELHLAAIRKAFSSPFVSSYGTTETGFVLEQCEGRPPAPEYRILPDRFSPAEGQVRRAGAGPDACDDVGESVEFHRPV